ncbi:MAG: prephenate dehydrogenase/arogenate dehydrogenase family protein [Candidatus Aquilonibacter sp.]
MARLGIIGTGLIGASIGLAARSRGWDVLGCDRDPAAAAGALRAEAIERVSERDEIYATCDAVVIAAHVSGTLEEIAGLRRRPLRNDQVILDVASVKAPIARAATGVETFVPTHPMAGGERRGPDAARADLFTGRVWCYVPTQSAAHTAQAVAFVEVLGAKAVAVEAEQHDAIVALTSHLPQLLAYAFSERVNERAESDGEIVDALCGPAARELLRLGRSSPQMWDEIFAENRDALEHEVQRFRKALDDRRLSR